MPTLTASARPTVLPGDRPIRGHRVAQTGARPPWRPDRRRPGRLARRIVAAVAALLTVLLLLALLPLPVLDRPLAVLVHSRVSSQVSCGGSGAAAPRITLKGGRLIPQLLRGTLSEIDLLLPDAPVGGVKHAAFAATLRNVSQPGPGTTHAGSVDASITVGFANMPSPTGVPKPTFGRAPDGSLTITTTPPAEAAKNVHATLLARLELHDEALQVVPQRLLVFGKALPAEQAASQTGGVRTEQLPHLPDGLSYRSVIPEPDGLHVALGGVVTTPFSELPAEVDGQSVAYSARDGMLGISTSKDLPLIGGIPLTIFTTPRIDGGTLTLVPRSVEVLGSNRKPSDPIAALVLSQVKQESLSQKLPELPAGVQYRSASVDGSGITVAIDGVTVRPFSELPTTIDGRSATYGAQDGLLAVTVSGAPADQPMSVVLHTRPTIAGTTLDLAPQRVELFGVQFPAEDVLAAIGTDLTRYPLQALPANLTYRRVEVLADGLRITLGGKNVTLTKDALGGTGCA